MTATFTDRYRIVREDLHRRFGGSVSAPEIDQVVDSVIAEHEAASTLEEFLPIMVERDARAKLFTLGTKRPEVLFTSRNNSARGQLAYALTRHLAGEGMYARATSVETRESVHPEVVQVLEERGISAESLYEKDDVARTAHRADVVVLLGIDEVPGLPGKRYESWDVAHPETLDEVRQAADAIEVKVRELLTEFGVPTRF